MKIQKIEMEFVTFNAQDIITTSGPVDDRLFTLSGLYDDEKGNIVFTASDGSFNYVDYAGSSLARIFEDGSLGNLTVSGNTKFVPLSGDGGRTASSLFSYDAGDDSGEANKWNGVYQWINSYFKRVQ